MLRSDVRENRQTDDRPPGQAPRRLSGVSSSIAERRPALEQTHMYREHLPACGMPTFDGRGDDGAHGLPPGPDRSPDRRGFRFVPCQESTPHQRFLSGLESGSQILTEIETTYPKRLRSALQTIGTHVAALDERVAQATRNLADLSTTTKEGNQEIRTSAAALLAELSEDSRKWAEASRAARDGLDGSTRAVRAREEAIKSSLDGMQTSMVKSQDSHDELAAAFSRLLADVRAMDQVIDEVASLLSRRVADLKNE